MRLDAATGWERLRRADHGILGTVHPERGVDLVPVVYAVDDTARVFIPVDTVKEKTSPKLQRLENLRSDARCMLLVEHYDPADWDRLWWIRLTGYGREATTEDTELFRPLLAARYHHYASPLDIAGGLVIEDGQMTGWAAR